MINFLEGRFILIDFILLFIIYKCSLYEIVKKQKNTEKL